MSPIFTSKRKDKRCVKLPGKFPTGYHAQKIGHTPNCLPSKKATQKRLLKKRLPKKATQKRLH